MCLCFLSIFRALSHLAYHFVNALKAIDTGSITHGQIHQRLGLGWELMNDSLLECNINILHVLYLLAQSCGDSGIDTLEHVLEAPNAWKGITIWGFRIRALPMYGGDL